MKNLDLILPDLSHLSLNREVQLEGSKSLANRALLLASCAKGTSILHNLPGERVKDVITMQIALTKLGVEFKMLTEGSYQVKGNCGQFSTRTAVLNCEESATCFRFLLATLGVFCKLKARFAEYDYHYTLVAKGSLSKRPHLDLFSCLESFGVELEVEHKENLLKVHLKSARVNSSDKVNQQENKSRILIKSEISSQFLSSLLLAFSIYPEARTEVELQGFLISQPYVDLTSKLLAKFGIRINQQNQIYQLQGNLTSGIYFIEPDATSASYFFVIGALSGCIKVKGLSQDSIQEDKNFPILLERMGAKVSYQQDGTTVAKGEVLQGIRADLSNMPDSALTLVIPALIARQSTLLLGISSWQHKESNRLSAIIANLERLGVPCKANSNSLLLTPPKNFPSQVEFDSYGDHRIAMTFALVAFLGVKVTIKNAACVEKTFAHYFEVLENLTGTSFDYVENSSPSPSRLGGSVN